MNTTITCHKDSGVDHHLGALGFRQRADWNIIVADDKNFATDYMSCRPDFLLHNHRHGHYITIEYKSRVLNRKGASLYEQYQSVCSQMVITECLYKQSGEVPQLMGVLLYGNGGKLEVSYGQRDEDAIFQCALVLGATLAQRPVAATELARVLSGADFSGVPEKLRRQGRQAHHSMVSLGPNRG